jgi:tRNA (mo5U34)-methyltransferase
MSLATRKRLRLGAVEVGMSLDAQQAERIRQSAPFRYVLRPALRALGRLTGRRRDRAPALPVLPPRRAVNLPRTPEAQALLDRVNAIEWYHTIELPHGITTPGFVDHRDQLHLYGLPDDMRGLRALDVATYDGFWAFEMERRGAEVTAIDIGSWAEFDIPLPLMAQARAAGAAEQITGNGFRLAHELLGSRVRREVLSVYHLAPERFGTFDVVFLSDLLLHLRDPQKALENICSVLRPGGFAIIADVYNPRLEHLEGNVTEFAGFGTYVWWLPSSATLKAMMREHRCRSCAKNASLSGMSRWRWRWRPSRLSACARRCPTNMSSGRRWTGSSAPRTVRTAGLPRLPRRTLPACGGR